MKKILAIVSMAAMVAGAAFAADVSASVYMTGSLLNVATGDTTTIKALTVNKQDQKDSDALIFNYAGESAGAHFQGWYNFAGEGSDALVVRSASLWFKPVDAVKVSVGNVGSYGYTERTNWWKAITGASAAQFAGWDHKYSNYIGVENTGVLAEITVDKLYATVGFTPDAGNWFFTKADDTTSYAAYGVTAQYTIADNIGAIVGWRDEGKDTTKILSIGANYGPYSGPFYQFVNARLYFDDHNNAYGSDDDGEGFGLRGIGIDNWGFVTAGALTVEYRVPVTVRGFMVPSGSTDPSFLTYQVKAKYALSNCTPYFDIDANDAAITFDDFGGTFEMAIQPGVNFNIGEAAFDASIRVSNIKKDGDIAIDVPVTARVSF